MRRRTRKEEQVERTSRVKEKIGGTYLAIIDPLTYSSVSKKNVGIETLTSNLVWSVKTGIENVMLRSE